VELFGDGGSGIEWAEAPRVNPGHRPGVGKTAGNNLGKMSKFLGQTPWHIRDKHETVDSHSVAHCPGGPFDRGALGSGEACKVCAGNQNNPAQGAAVLRDGPGVIGAARTAGESGKRGLPRSPGDAEPPDRCRVRGGPSGKSIGLVWHWHALLR